MDVLFDAKQPARSRIESLWALASVPLDVANLGFLSGQPNTPRIAGNSDELEPATIDLLGTPQFPFDATKTNFLRDPHVAERLWVPDAETALPTPTHRARRLLASMRLLPFEDALLSVSANDPFLLAAAVHRIKQSDISSTELTRLLQEFTSRTDNSAPAWPQRLAIVLAARGKYPKAAELAELALQDPGLQIRRVAVQWVGEERLEQLRARVEDGLNDKRITSELFLATLAALEMLDGKNPVNFDKTPAGTYVLPLVHDARRPAAVRALALRMVSPADPALTAKLLGSLLVSDDATLRQEAIRTLQSSPLREAGELLRSAAADESEQTSLRAEAILGLASFAQSSKPGDPIGQLLRKLARSDNHELRTESLRSLRGLAATDGELRRQLETDLEQLAGTSKITSAETEYADQLAMALIGKDGQMPHVSSALAARRPTTGNDWLGASKASPGDPAAGRRVFYHSHSAGCYKCHTVNGRGGQVGPDLSVIGRTQDRDKLCQSLLEPSKEIAPQFVSWRLETRDGRVLSGLIVHENEGRTIIGNPEGQLSELRTADIEQRIPQQISLMPEKLVEKLTVQEFCDLVAFLETLK
jgi:putative heme-binding domain-containing protein